MLFSTGTTFPLSLAGLTIVLLYATLYSVHEYSTYCGCSYLFFFCVLTALLLLQLPTSSFPASLNFNPQSSIFIEACWASSFTMAPAAVASNGNHAATNGHHFVAAPDINDDPDRVKFAYWVPNVSGGLVISKIPQRTQYNT